MKTLLRFLAVFSIALLPALSETKKERAHEAVAASQPQTDDSQTLASQQIDKSISDLKEALNGLRDSLKKGDRKSFSL
jgi:methionine-rich copper-binding protein CopC